MPARSDMHQTGLLCCCVPALALFAISDAFDVVLTGIAELSKPGQLPIRALPLPAIANHVCCLALSDAWQYALPLPRKLKLSRLEFGQRLAGSVRLDAERPVVLENGLMVAPEACLD